MDPKLQSGTTSSHLLVILAVGLTLICFWPSLQNGWVNWDDDAYVLRNPMVQELSLKSVRSMFSTPEQVGLYHPLTLLSLAVDHHVWGNNAFGYHLSSLILHLVNVVLVFLFIRRLGGNAIAAFMAALLFGMHPMHVESVAWVSGRKDVLYTVGYLVSLIAYLQYLNPVIEHKSRWYWVSLLAFLFALLAKSLAFTLPLILVLVDFVQKRSLDRNAWLEKLPFVLLALLAFGVAHYGQDSSGSLLGTEGPPFWKTVFWGSYNVVYYLAKCLVPVALSPFHPFPSGEMSPPDWLFYASAIPVGGLVYLLYRSFRQAPNLFFGLAFFLVCLAPVLQIIPFGKALSSERYTYVAYIGLFFLIGRGVATVLNASSTKLVSLKPWLLGGLVLWWIALAFQTFRQVQVWQSGETLWSQVVERYPNSAFAYYSRGMYRVDRGTEDEALADLNRSLELQPSRMAYYERGRLFEKMEHPERALEDYGRALALDSAFARAWHNRGILLAATQPSEALASFNRAIQGDTAYALAYLNRGLLLRMLKEPERALADIARATQLEPWNARFQKQYGVLLREQGEYPEAIRAFEKARELEPFSGEPFFLRSTVRWLGQDSLAAVQDARKALEMGWEVPDDYLRLIGLRPAR